MAFGDQRRIESHLLQGYYLAAYIRKDILQSMNSVREIREATGMTQQELARAAGTSQPAIAAYEAERKSPTLRTLRRLASAAGLEVSVTIVPQLTREDRRSLALHAAIAERLTARTDETIARARATLKRMREANPNASALLREWDVLLQRPLIALLPVLSDQSLWARELRHVTPFAGVLAARARANVYREFARAEDARAEGICVRDTSP